MKWWPRWILASDPICCDILCTLNHNKQWLTLSGWLADCSDCKSSTVTKTFFHLLNFKSVLALGSKHEDQSIVLERVKNKTLKDGDCLTSWWTLSVRGSSDLMSMLIRKGEKLKDDGCPVLMKWQWKQQSYFGDEDRFALLSTPSNVAPLCSSQGLLSLLFIVLLIFDCKRKPESPSLS